MNTFVSSLWRRLGPRLAPDFQLVGDFGWRGLALPALRRVGESADGSTTDYGFYLCWKG